MNRLEEFIRQYEQEKKEKEAIQDELARLRVAIEEVRYHDTFWNNELL